MVSLSCAKLEKCLLRKGCGEKRVGRNRLPELSQVHSFLGKIMHRTSGTVFPKSIHQFLGMSFSLPADMGTQFEDHI